MAKLESPLSSNERARLTLEEKSLIERIEKLKTDDTARWLILLTWKGLKPVSEFSFAKYDSKDDPGRAMDIIETEKLLHDLGLFSNRIEEELKGERFDKSGNSKPMNFHQDNYYIAKDEKNLQYFTDHFGKPEDFEISKKLGSILGYPKSAIEAWVSPKRNTNLLDTKNEQPELYARDEMAFAKFRLSKQNWAAEVKTIQKWAAEVKYLDPLLYERVVQNRRRVIARE